MCYKIWTSVKNKMEETIYGDNPVILILFRSIALRVTFVTHWGNKTNFVFLVYRAVRMFCIILIYKASWLLYLTIEWIFLVVFQHVFENNTELLCRRLFLKNNFTIKKLWTTFIILNFLIETACLTPCFILTK